MTCCVPGQRRGTRCCRTALIYGSCRLLEGWARLGRPVIIRRRLPGDAANDVPAALPLPPDHGKRRIALSFPPGAALAALPPVRLRDAAAAAPADWQRVIASLVAAGEGGRHRALRVRRLAVAARDEAAVPDRAI